MSCLGKLGSLSYSVVESHCERGLPAATSSGMTGGVVLMEVLRIL